MHLDSERLGSRLAAEHITFKYFAISSMYSYERITLEEVGRDHVMATIN